MIKFNILYYLDCFPKISETFILNEICELDKRGHNVAVFALHNPEEQVVHEDFEDLDIPIYYANIPSYYDFSDLFSKKILNKRVLTNIGYKMKPKYIAANLHFGKQCINFIEKLDFEIDIIHCHFANHPKIGASHAAIYKNIPFAVTTHAKDIFVNKYAEKILKKSDKIITISQYNKNFIKQNYEISKPINVVPVSVNPRNFEPKGLEVKNKIVSVGRFVEKKGFEYGIESFSELKKNHTKLRYIIIGEGELESELKQKAGDLGVSDDIEFKGFVDDDELKKQMEEAKLLLVPSIEAKNGDKDGIPTVIKESMMLSTPVVSTYLSGIPEAVLNKETGLLAQPGDPKELAKKMDKILRSKRVRETYSKNSRKYAKKNFDIKKNIDNLEKLFKQLNVRGNNSR